MRKDKHSPQFFSKKADGKKNVKQNQGDQRTARHTQRTTFFKSYRHTADPDRHLVPSRHFLPLPSKYEEITDRREERHLSFTVWSVLHVNVCKKQLVCPSRSFPQINDNLIFLLPPGTLWNLDRKLIGKDSHRSLKSSRRKLKRKCVKTKRHTFCNN